MTGSASAAVAPTRIKLIPIVEIFGPTIQGEGAEAGVPTHFVRVGGCDYRCSWCDTMYAVDPELVRATADYLAIDEIAARVLALKGRPAWTTISGGNPALHELGELVEELRDVGFLISVETQGSLWRAWLGSVDRLTISPKPPSSRMATTKHLAQLDQFMTAAMKVCADRAVLKIVIFNEQDLQWARTIGGQFSGLPLYLSVGTPVPVALDVRDQVADRYRWLCERVSVDPTLNRARVLPQLHVIAWTGARGV